MDCYCNSSKKYIDCCYPFLSGKILPETPEELMRSRYSAFCTKHVEYLVSTHHPSCIKPNEFELINQTCRDTQWCGLKILKVEKKSNDNQIGYVEFVAFYQNEPIGQLHENSKFIYENGQWYYFDGVILDSIKYLSI